MGSNTTSRIIVVVLAIKLILFLWAGYSYDFSKHPEENWISIWNRWDTKFYETIATSGYRSEGLAEDYWALISHMGPLYPVFTGGIARMTQIPLPVTGMLVSIGAIIGASILLFKVMCREFENTRAAWMSVLFLNVFPTAYVTIGAYSESLLILLSIAGIYYVRTQQYVLSGLAAAGTILTRIIAVVFLPLYGAYILYDVWNNRNIHWKVLYLPGIALASFGLYFFINQVYYNDSTYFLTEQVSFRAKTQHLIVPFSEMSSWFLTIFKNNNYSNHTFMMHFGWNAILVFFVLVVTLIGFKKLPCEYSLYAVLSLLIVASLSWGISSARYVLPIFPMFMTLGLIKSRVVSYGLLTVFAFLLLYFTKTFNSGTWAF